MVRTAEAAALIADIGEFQHDPLGYVRYAFSWGDGELIGQDGPREWQATVLDEVGRLLREGADMGAAMQLDHGGQ